MRRVDGAGDGINPDELLLRALHALCEWFIGRGLGLSISSVYFISAL